ncbi:MAG TPA: ABC transporter ATP-binding protein [Myxococcaceae bacterium]|nr:ABC transporter ATP-binding protein [Myxococcaceae bacterium]
MSSAPLSIEALVVGYREGKGLKKVVEGLSLALPAGEIGCLLGASGCGKTTLLRAIAGFEHPVAGRISLDGKLLADASTRLPPEQRRVGIMFQDYALFPHLTVEDNVGFGLKGLPRAKRRERIGALLELVGLSGVGHRLPHALSGGQQQRVALARALAPEPSLLLLDEPFSNLDVHTRVRLATELRGLLKAAGTTVLLVTHDQAEAFAIADRVGVMESGRLLQWDAAAELYFRPAAPEVATFVGRGVFVPGEALGRARDVRLLVRPEHLRPSNTGVIRAEVIDCAFRGPGYVARVRLATGVVLEVELPDGTLPAPGAPLLLAWSEGAHPPTFPLG